MALAHVSLHWVTECYTCACVLSHFSCVRLFAALWTVTCQTTLSMGFSRQKYWSGLPCPPPGDLLDPGIEPASFISPTLVVGSLPLAPPGKPKSKVALCKKFPACCIHSLMPFYLKVRLGRSSLLVRLYFVIYFYVTDPKHFFVEHQYSEV